MRRDENCYYYDCGEQHIRYIKDGSFSLLYSMVQAIMVSPRTESKSIDKDLVVPTVDIELTRLLYNVFMPLAHHGLFQQMTYNKP